MEEKYIDLLLNKCVDFSSGILFIHYNKLLKDDDRDYNYYIYIPNYGLITIDKNKLKYYLESGIYEIFDKSKDIEIKGIDYISNKIINMDRGRIK